jgi:hypothetical protein
LHVSSKDHVDTSAPSEKEVGASHLTGTEAAIGEVDVGSASVNPDSDEPTLQGHAPQQEVAATLNRQSSRERSPSEASWNSANYPYDDIEFSQHGSADESEVEVVSPASPNPTGPKRRAPTDLGTPSQALRDNFAGSTTVTDADARWTVAPAKKLRATVSNTARPPDSHSPEAGEHIL